jgi:chromate transporter
MNPLGLADWAWLFGHFLLLSLLAIGGAIVIAPDLHRLMVAQAGLLTDAQFNAAVAIAQAAPGPNVLFVALLGYQAAGLAGAAATLGGIMAPSTTVALLVSRWGQARQDWRVVRAFRAGMAPVTIALLLATGWILAAETPGRAHLLLTAAAAVAVWRTKIHLLVLLGAGTIAGALGWI